jgi:phage-related tail protein
VDAMTTELKRMKVNLEELATMVKAFGEGYQALDQRLAPVEKLCQELERGFGRLDAHVVALEMNREDLESRVKALERPRSSSSA